MIFIKCPNIKDGEDIHNHSCIFCKGDKHLPFSDVLKHHIRELSVWDDEGLFSPLT